MITRVDGEINLEIPSNATIIDVCIKDYFDKPMCLFVEYSLNGKVFDKVFEIIRSDNNG